MKKFIITALVLGSQMASAHPEMNAGLAKMCYAEIVNQASIALSIGADQADDEQQAKEMKKKLAELQATVQSVVAVETACGEVASSEDEKNSCIADSFAIIAADLAKEYQVEGLKEDSVCGLVLP